MAEWRNLGVPRSLFTKLGTTMIEAFFFTAAVAIVAGAVWLGLRSEAAQREADARLSEDELYERWIDRQW